MKVINAVSAVLIVILWSLVVAREFVPPCEYEDGADQAICYWDASSSGNGDGRSFTVWQSRIYLYDDGELVFV